MTILVSPAKTLDFETPAPLSASTELLFADKAAYLAAKLAKMSPGKLRSMMDISEDLAQLNASRYRQWSLDSLPENGKQAIYAFQGDVYQGLKAEEFDPTDLEWAQEHVRILSGLYGVLRPTDMMLPYRLEMGTTWQITPKTKNLYAYWQKSIATFLMEDMAKNCSKVLLNLASQEYAKAADLKKVKAEVVAPEFREERNGRFQMISFFAKKARGLMAAYVVKNQIVHQDDLKAFDSEGYAFNERLSNLKLNKWVYTRNSNNNQ